MKMHTFQPKQEQSSRRASSGNGKPSTLAHSISQRDLQSATRGQAMSGLSQAGFEDGNAGFIGSHGRLTYNFANISVFPSQIKGIQRKLTVNAPGDAYEQEADRVAEQVMRMPEPGATATPAVSGGVAGVQRECACGGSCDDCKKKTSETEHAQVRMKAAGPGIAGGIEAPPIVGDVLRSSGQPLDAGTRAFMEPRFGHDFSKVRVHTDAKAGESARAVQARAYTVGSNVVFGAGEFNPGTDAGQRLMGHELAHVVQQERSDSPGMIQRRETDDRSCAGLKDIESDIDQEVNNEISSARNEVAAKTPSGSPKFIKALAENVYSRLGKGVISPIESFIEKLGGAKINRPPMDLAGTKYSGVRNVNRKYYGGNAIVASSANIAGVCVGADKLGHFFDLGFRNWNAASSGTTAEQIEKINRGTEIGEMGLGFTGVYSNADLEANHAGWRFYNDLAANPSGLKFTIKNYITAQWNEQINPSFYEPALGEVVWSNLLTGKWRGTITGQDKFTADILFDLGATKSSLSGTYEWPTGTAKPNQGKITGGTITQLTTTVSGDIPPSILDPHGHITPGSATPVSGVKIEFDWARGALSGKGLWNSVNEHTLDGSWGHGASRTDGGVLHLNKA